jgi:hypothetical protein
MCRWCHRRFLRISREYLLHDFTCLDSQSDFEVAVAIIIHIISPRTNPAIPASEFLVRRRPRRATRRRRGSSRPEEPMESKKASEDSEETTARRKSIFNRSKSFAGALLRPEAGPSSSNSSKWRRPSISRAISALKGASPPAVMVEDASAVSPSIPNPGRHRRPSLMRALTNFRAHSAFEPANPPGLETRGPIEGSAFGDYSIVVQKPLSIVDPADRLSEAGLVDMPVIPGSTPPIGHRRTRAIPTMKRKDYGISHFSPYQVWY